MRRQVSGVTRGWCLGAVGALALLVTTPLALATPPGPGGDAATSAVRADMRVLLAKKGPPHVDPGLSDVAEYLQRGLVRYQHFTMLGGGGLDLSEGERGSVSVPGDGSVTLTYLGLKDKLLRFKAQFQDLTVRVKLSDGGVFIQAGRKHGDGILVYLIGARAR